MSYWHFSTGYGPITDETVFFAMKDSNLFQELVDDDIQDPVGGVWKHILDMEQRGLICIENGIVRRR